jgi:hypothetical protein
MSVSPRTLWSWIARGALLVATLLAVLVPRAAPAFCGFFVSGADAKLYNNASQVVLLRKGNHTEMSMSNNYQGPPEDFAMVVPVPVVLKKEQVKTLPTHVFARIDALSAPRLVEYWEQDPCYLPRSMKKGAPMRGAAIEDSADEEKSEKKHGVKIEAKFEVGEYQIVILSAKDSTGLDAWLRENRYKIPAGADVALAPYVREQMKFFVAKVDIKKVQRDRNGFVVLSPLRFGFDSQELRLPVRLGLLNANGKQDLLIYILHPEKRFEVANYPNVFIPTNVEVADEVRKGFGSFYAELFDETLRRNNNKAVVTEYSWQASSCDPCPLPPLNPLDVYLFGDESMGSRMQSMSGDDEGGYYGDPVPYVLTRLHTRYDKAALDADLIFREAKPVVGGRANWGGGLGDHGAQIQPEGSENNFQGRYIIRHYWEGKVACENPRYGRWGGPPRGDMAALRKAGSDGKPQAAQDLANAPRGKVKLAAVVQTPVPELGLKGKKRALRPKEKAGNPDAEE